MNLRRSYRVPPLLYSDYRALGTCFQTRPIGTLRTLARMLRWPGCQKSPAELQRVADQANSLYRVAGVKRKPDGTVRHLFDAKFPLKTIQGRIQSMILVPLIFPIICREVSRTVAKRPMLVGIWVVDL